MGGNAEKYLKMLVEDFHTAVAATTGADGKPETRAIDMMLCDGAMVYFLTAKGKNFYERLAAQKFLALSACKGKAAVSLRGEVRNVGSEKLGEILEANPYMKEIYPEGTCEPLQVFCFADAQGEYFDISVPSRVVRCSFSIGGGAKPAVGAYTVGEKCNACGN